MSIQRLGTVIAPAAQSLDRGLITQGLSSVLDFGSVADLFPDPPGLQWDVHRQPMWKTILHTSASGRDTGAGLWAYPRWQYTLSYELLRSTDLEFEWQVMAGFFNQHKGRLIPFFYLDPEDNSVTDQFVGYGDNETTRFQLQRTLGQSGAGFTEPVQAVTSATIYIDGLPETSGISIDRYGMLTFDAAPASGVLITADLSWCWRCRFLADQADFRNFMYKYWELQKVEFITLKVGDW